MSHFVVAVFTNKRTTVEELLEPYDEELAVDKYLQYTKAQLIENARRELEETRTTTYVTLCCMTELKLTGQSPLTDGGIVV